MNTEHSSYERLVDAVDACAPGYWREHALPIGQADIARALEQGAPGMAPALREAGSIAILERWSHRGLRFDSGAGKADPVAAELLKSVSDAAAGIADGVPELGDADTILAEQYAAIYDASGTLLAYRRKQGGTPLLLLNAFGIPLRIWHRLLGGQHDYQIIVPVLSNCDPVQGGMQDDCSVSALVAQLQTLLAQLDSARVNVLAWCNAGRLGIALLNACASRIGQLILLSPTLRGGETEPGHQSPYENNLLKLFKLVRASPKSATAVSTMLGQPAALPDWAGLPDPQVRADVLFSLPRLALSGDLSKPMAKPASLIHYAARTHSDEAISAGQSGALPARPITLIQGQHDAVVSNEQARHWLSRFAAQVDVYVVSGAGHYIQDLQFAYLKLILDRVIQPSRDGAPVTTAALPARIRFQ